LVAVTKSYRQVIDRSDWTFGFQFNERLRRNRSSPDATGTKRGSSRQRFLSEATCFAGQSLSCQLGSERAESNSVALAAAAKTDGSAATAQPGKHRRSTASDAGSGEAFQRTRHTRSRHDDTFVTADRADGLQQFNAPANGRWFDW
jgi:hypothetical protein